MSLTLYSHPFGGMRAAAQRPNKAQSKVESYLTRL
jgi:hypothetical protein